MQEELESAGVGSGRGAGVRERRCWRAAAERAPEIIQRLGWPLGAEGAGRRTFFPMAAAAVAAVGRTIVSYVRLLDLCEL